MWVTGAVPAMKPEATAIGDPQDGHWKITWTFDGRRFCIPKFRYYTLQQTTRQWRHWWFPTTSCFGVTNHSEAASLWLVRQDWSTINSGSPPSCDVTFWQWSVASPSEMDWLASKVSRYLSVLCLCPGSKAVKRSSLLLLLSMSMVRVYDAGQLI